MKASLYYHDVAPVLVTPLISWYYAIIMERAAVESSTLDILFDGNLQTPAL